MSYMALSVSEGIVGKILILASKLFLDFSILVYTEFKDNSVAQMFDLVRQVALT